MKVKVFSAVVLVTLFLSLNLLFCRSSEAARSIEPLNHRVVDAEYSKALNRIVTVSNTPSNQLHIYNPSTFEDIAVNLHYAPTCVSVAPDGLSAVVGHYSYISYVKLEAHTLVKTIPVSCMARDVVLAGNGYAYVFGSYGKEIRCIELKTGKETLSTGLTSYARYQAKVHPDGRTIYQTNDGGSPADIRKFDISEGTAVYLYDSPYHGDYPMGGDLWISEDGSRIFTKEAGRVFRSSTVKTEDMRYNGSLVGISFISQMSHSLAAGRVAAIPGEDAKVRILEDGFLNLISERKLPRIKGFAGYYQSRGRFVFFNAAGTKFYVVVKAAPGANLPFEYGVVSYPTNVPKLTVSTSAGVGGRMAPQGPIAVGYGNSQTVSIVPDTGYEIAEVLVDGASIGKKSSYLFSDVVEDHTIDARFSPCADCSSKPFRILNHKVVDSEYDKALDRVITISETPKNQLHIYDPATQEDIPVDLPLAPTCLSVGPGGIHAAVGHDGWVSYVDLTAPTLLKTVPVSARAADIVLAGNGHAYLVPIRSINLETGEETQSDRYDSYSVSRAKLHPGGQSIYLAERGVSPEDLVKADISSGTATYLYDSPYHGDYPMGGNLWISEDGFRIFTEAGSVFSASEERSEDMVYKGSLAGMNSIVHLAQSTAAGKVIAIAGELDREARVYDYNTFGLLSSPLLPHFEADGNIFPGHGKFAFFNRKSDTCFFIMQGSDMPIDYGIVTLPAQALSQPFTINASAGPGGTIDPPGAVRVDLGRSITFTAAPQTGYKLTKIFVDGVDVGTGPTYTFDHVTSNHKIKAVFAHDVDYFAVEVGNTRSFEVTDLNTGVVTEGTSIVGLGPVYDQAQSYRVEQNLEGVVSSSWYLKESNGLFLKRASNSQVKVMYYDPLLVVKKDLKSGMSWSSETDTNRETHVLLEASVGEPGPVGVKAGKFLAFPIAYRMTTTGQQGTNTAKWSDYFVPYVGIVKSKSADESVRLTAYAVGGGEITARPPALTEVNPASGPVGRQVKITGYHFGNTQGKQVLKIGSTRITDILSWTDTEIECAIPAGAKTGILTIDGAALPSSSMARFTVAP